jgi:hypothetical protein
VKIAGLEHVGSLGAYKVKVIVPVGEPLPMPPPLKVAVSLIVPPSATLGEATVLSVVAANPGPAALHPPAVLVPASVTSPAAAAKARPVRLAPVPRWTPVCATTFPANVAPLRVAKLVTCQNTLQGLTPFRTTFEPTLAVSELVTWKM